MRGQIRRDEVESAVLKAPHLTGLRQFPATEISVSEARDWARSLLSLGVPSPVLDDVLLLLGEVVTNAITHSNSGRAATGKVTVRVVRTGRTVQVQVTDAGSSTSVPAVRAPSLDDDTGRGLWMVDMLADAWGFEHNENDTSAWFRLTGPERQGDGRM
ncbi:ATP-binding protein [Nonomuraea sp. NPDC026600]|uniref:ATP-binding protein n=1 Tax=Nonomuraea sp. NPDC026600 TaxID=3155363 RepID=UPI0034034F56